MAVGLQDANWSRSLTLPSLGPPDRPQRAGEFLETEQTRRHAKLDQWKHPELMVRQDWKPEAAPHEHEALKRVFRQGNLKSLLGHG